LILRRIHKFLALKWELKKAILWALLVSGAIRLCLLLLPFQKVLNISRFISQRPFADLAHNLEPGEICWAVEAAGSCLPATTCLAQALAGKVLLAWKRQDATLCIGVAKDGEVLKAHAWLKSEGKIVIGDTGLEEYSKLPCFDEAMK